jgi:hypothetical protein
MAAVLPKADNRASVTVPIAPVLPTRDPSVIE